LGGAPGLVSGPSGLGAIAIRFLVSTHGPEYIFYSVILCGFCQVLFGALRLGKYLRLLPTGITIGMVNGLCVLLMALQLRYFKLYPTAQASYAETNSTSAAEVEDNYFEPTRYLESITFSDNIAEDTLNQPWAYFLGYDLPWDTSKSQVIIVSVEAIVAMLICHFFPKFIAIVPSSLLAILLLTGVNSIIPADSVWVAPTVSDYFVWEVSTFVDCYWNDE
jgi:MFS superfamily sulfate permease-like transporter